MKKPVILPFALIALLAPVVALALLPGCKLVHQEEVLRVDAPKGELQALLIRTAIADSGPSDYDVVVVESGRRAWLGKEVAFLAGARREPRVEWDSEGVLRVLHGSVTSRQLEHPEVEIGDQRVYVSLQREWGKSAAAGSLDTHSRSD